MRVAEGSNYAIDVDDVTAHLRVWKRRDLSTDVASRLAEELVDKVRDLTKRPTIDRFVLDLREGPILIGKRTRAALGDLVFECEKMHRPVAVLANPGVQWILLERVIVVAPTASRLFVDPDAARDWLDTR